MRYWVQLLKLKRINVDGREITLDNAESLLKDLGKGTLDRNEFKREYNNIADDVKTTVNKAIITRKQEKTVEIMLLLKKSQSPAIKNLMNNQIL